MAVTTTLGHVSRALDFYDRDDVYFAYGRTTTWPNDSNGKAEGDPLFQPPLESIQATTLEELVGYKKVEIKHMVVPDENGTIYYRQTKWKIVPKDQAKDQGARWVYISSTFAYDELPLEDYRQIGVFSRLVKKGSVSAGKLNLLPADVQDQGILEVIDNRKVVTRQLDQKENVELIIEY